MSTRLPAPERRRQLLDCALVVFAEHGYHDASMNRVAEAAGVTKPVLYQHFASKKDLFSELLEDVGSRLETAIVAAVAEARSPREQVEFGFRAFFRFIAGNRTAATMMFTGGSRLGDPDFVRTLRRVEDTIADAIAELIVVEGLSPERRRLLAFGIVGLTEATAARWVEHDPELSADELAAQLAELAWAGLRGVRSPTPPRQVPS